ncbi:transposase [Mycobacterium sp. MS1601]|uniref:3-keto-5-aminohexanoate cleavage protein n=1 Tax=Mycobacterium sp. MS1601 TaxID=1936029 RepID=UPI00097962B4|nr:3-keto-5-aminohexanoate cleavage protein [Mycobacterium sp. MS1601]AQA01634.1 transposase [Mycobacterium sp. MS1601]
MYFTDRSLLPENQPPLIITAAPYGPMWLPSDFPGEVPVTWDEQVQKAVDCFEAGARILHVHVRDPKTGKISKNISEYGAQIARLREAVPDMVLQVGGSISFAPEGDEAAHWQTYDTRHMLAEIDPKPDQITVAIGSSLFDVTALADADDVAGTHLADPNVRWQYAQMVADATPEFYIEHLKRLRTNGIQAYFALAHVHSLEIVERLIRTGQYMGPVNGFYSMVGGGTAGSNPFDLMELIRRAPHGSCFTYQSVFRLVWPISAMCIALGQHVRAGIEENLWGSLKGQKLTSVEMVQKMVRMADELGRPIATPEETKRILKLGEWYDTPEQTLFNLGLPPNREVGQRGFLTYETDGRLLAPVEMPSDPRYVL